MDHMSSNDHGHDPMIHIILFTSNESQYFNIDILESGSWRIMEITEDTEFGSWWIMRNSQIMIMDHGPRSWSKSWISDHDHGPDWIMVP